MMRYFLGIDGGQSSTTALIGDQTGRVIGDGRAGPCNHVSAPEGRAKLTAAIAGCIREACAKAQLNAARISFASACLGFSGGPADKEAIVREFLRARKLSVTNDALIALAGATGGEPGVVVISGTGSIALGRNAAGKIARAGGWGYLFGDEGGGFDIARQALRAALRMEEGWGPVTVLRQKLLDATGASNANELMHRMYAPEFSRPRIARLSRLVDQAACEGDGIASAILENAALSLAEIAQAVRMRLFNPEETALISYVGGGFRNELLLTAFRALVERHPRNLCVAPRHGPAAGALLEAYRIAGLRVTLSHLPEREK